MTAWANFQGPFTLHGVAAAALGIPGAQLRLLTPSESGGSFGIKAAVLHAVVLMAIASRCLGVPVRWTEDRGEHLLAASMATERTSEVEAAFDAAGRLLGLRLDLIDDVGAYVRAPEPATLYRMHGCLTGAYDVQDLAVRSRVVVTNRAPSGLNRGFGGPQLYGALERTMAHRRAAARPRPRRARAPQPRARRADALPGRGGGGLRLGRLRAPASSASSSSPATRSCGRRRRSARAEGRLRRHRPRLRRRAERLQHGLHHARADRRGAGTGLPKSGNAEGVTIAIGPHGGVTLRITTTPQGQGHRTVAAQVAADVLGLEPEQIDVRTDADTAANPGRSPRATTRAASRDGCLRGPLAATRLAERLRALAAPILECRRGRDRARGGRARVRGDEARSVSSAGWPARRTGTRATSPARRRRGSP